jgi:hypothetical protein
MNVTNFELTLKLGDYEYSLFLPKYTGYLQKGANVIKKKSNQVYINA